MAIPVATETDVYETSSFSSLIHQEECEEIIPLDLHAASLIGDHETVQEFIMRKDDLNKINRGGWTPLMYAAYVGRDNILNSLLEAGADVDVQSRKHGQTALMLASYCASESIIYYLLQRGACINMQDHQGRTSLFHAVKQGHQSAVNLLASHGADVNLSEYNSGTTPLMEAAISGHDNIFNTLLSHGANLKQCSKSGESVRHLAQCNGNTIICNLIDAAAQSEETTCKDIDVNQGPREFLQLCSMKNVPPLDNSQKNLHHKSSKFSETSDMTEMGETYNKESSTPRYQCGTPLPGKVRKLFEEFNVTSYLPMFEKHGIDLATFLTLTDDDMKAIGVEKLGPRKRVKLVIDRYRQMMKTQSTDLSDPLQNEHIDKLNMQLQQAAAYIHELQTNEHQYRSDFGKYVEAEQQRMRQILFYINDIGKNCKEAIGQIRKIKDHHRRMDSLLSNIKEHPNSESLSSELRIDSSLYDSANSVKCEIEMASNRLDMTCKQVERTLSLAQMNMPQANQK